MTLDAGHAGLELEQALAGQHGGQQVLTIKGNCQQTHATLQGIDWEASAERRAGDARWVRSHGRWERRSLAACTLRPRQLSFRHARQGFRVRRETCKARGGPVTVTDACGITSLAAGQASAQDLLDLVRGHWQVESANHCRRDTTFREDSSRIRTGHGPAACRTR